ncbi:hypothetical protein ATKI12_8874 [Kitasatospora sp. Ki12]
MGLLFGRQGGDVLAADGEGEGLQVLAGPVGGVALFPQEEVHPLELLVDEVGVEREGQVQAVEAFAAGEELVQGHPEGAGVVAVDGVTGAEEPGVRAGHLHGEVGGEALRHRPEGEWILPVEGGELAVAGVVVGFGGSHPGDAGPGEAEVGVAAVHGAGGVAVVQGEDDDAERVAPGELADPVQAGGPDPVDVVLDGLDLGQGRERAESAVPAVGEHGRRGEGVVEEAARRAAGFDAAGGQRRGEVAEARDGAVDFGDGLVELGGQVPGAEVERAPGDGVQERAPALVGEAGAGVGDRFEEGSGGRRGRRLVLDGEPGEPEQEPACGGPPHDIASRELHAVRLLGCAGASSSIGDCVVPGRDGPRTTRVRTRTDAWPRAAGWRRPVAPEGALASWPQADARAFARLLRRFVDEGPFAAGQD